MENEFLSLVINYFPHPFYVIDANNYENDLKLINDQLGHEFGDQALLDNIAY